MELGCQTCLRVIKDPSEGVFINSISSINGELSLKEKLLDLVPELVLDSHGKAILCTSCMENLQSAYKFKQACIETQEKIYGFLQLVPENGAIDVGKIAVHFCRLELIAQGIIPIVTEAETSLRCKLCEFSCVDENVLIRHQNSHPPYKCKRCPFIFPTAALLQDHLATYCKEECFSCMFCDFVANSLKELAEHTSLKHNKKEHNHQFVDPKALLYVCGLCKFKSESLKALRSHVPDCRKNYLPPSDTSTKIPKTPFHCGLCKFKTSRPKILGNHIHKVHLAPYHCKQCPVACATELRLQNHIERVHKDKVEAPISVGILGLDDMVLKQLNNQKRDTQTRTVRKVKFETSNEDTLGPPCKFIKLEAPDEPPNKEASKSVKPSGPQEKVPDLNVPEIPIIRKEGSAPPSMVIKSEPNVLEDTVILNCPSRMVLEQLNRWKMEAIELACKSIKCESTANDSHKQINISEEESIKN